MYNSQLSAAPITARGERTFRMKPSSSFSTFSRQAWIYGCEDPEAHKKIDFAHNSAIVLTVSSNKEFRK